MRLCGCESCPKFRCEPLYCQCRNCYEYQYYMGSIDPWDKQLLHRCGISSSTCLIWKEKPLIWPRESSAVLVHQVQHGLQLTFVERTVRALVDSPTSGPWRPRGRQVAGWIGLAGSHLINMSEWTKLLYIPWKDFDGQVSHKDHPPIFPCFIAPWQRGTPLTSLPHQAA